MNDSIQRISREVDNNGLVKLRKHSHLSSAISIPSDLKRKLKTASLRKKI